MGKKCCNTIIRGVVEEDGEVGFFLGCEGRKRATHIDMDEVTNSNSVFGIVRVRCLGDLLIRQGMHRELRGYGEEGLATPVA